MEVLWKSANGYVVVADGLEWPPEGEQGKSDLQRIMEAGAWLAVWRTSQDQTREEYGDLWYVARSRRTPKPSLNALRHALRTHVDGGNAIADAFSIAPEDRQGKVRTDDPVVVGQALYSAWGYVALDALPAKIEFMKLNPDDYDPLALSAWLRPGIPLHRERRREFRELMQELAE